MKVILSHDVKALGRKGDVKEVANGYARNYLVPKGMAVPATETNLRRLTEEKQAVKTHVLHEEDEARAMAVSLEGTQVTIKAKAGESGRLFGSVTTKDIAEAIERTTRIKLDRKKIDLGDGLKHVGHYDVPVKLYHGISVAIAIDVVEEEA